jgi:hypothetical protein
MLKDLWVRERQGPFVCCNCAVCIVGSVISPGAIAGKPISGEHGAEDSLEHGAEDSFPAL